MATDQAGRASGGGWGSARKKRNCATAIAYHRVHAARSVQWRSGCPSSPQEAQEMKALLALLALASAALAADVHVAWDKPPQAESLKGFNVWCGTNSGQYDFYIQVNGYTNTDVIFTGLTPAQTYYVAAESVSTNGMISPMSEELVVVPPAPPLNLHIVIEQGNPLGVWQETTNIFDVAVFPVEQSNLFLRARLRLD